MSTNPFDNDTAPISRRAPTSYRKQRHYRRDHDHSNMINLTETSSSSHLHYNNAQGGGGTGHTHILSNNEDNAIWEARNIDWPMSSTLPAGIYNKLFKTSVLLGNAMGMTVTHGNYASLANVGVTGESEEKGGGLAMEGAGSSSVAAAAGYYGAFGGLMGKFMKNPNQTLMNGTYSNV